jgi:hypothetical protein
MPTGLLRVALATCLRFDSNWSTTATPASYEIFSAGALAVVLARTMLARCHNRALHL